jgi:hypothetical protein
MGDNQSGHAGIVSGRMLPAPKPSSFVVMTSQADAGVLKVEAKLACESPRAVQSAALREWNHQIFGGFALHHGCCSLFLRELDVRAWM